MVNKQQEARETAETLIEERGFNNAMDWAEHCLTRSNDGFWRMVRNEVMRLKANADNQLKHFRG